MLKTIWHFKLWNRQLPLGKNKKSDWINDRWIWWTNHEKIAVLKAKTYSYLKDNNDEDKKVKSKKCVSQKENLNLKIINNV